MTRGCERCGGVVFKRERDFFEREYCTVEADDYLDPMWEDNELEGPTSEWRVECVGCGATGTDIEDMLSEPESDEDMLDIARLC
jgi:hypothetical protein